MGKGHERVCVSPREGSFCRKTNNNVSRPRLKGRLLNPGSVIKWMRFRCAIGGGGGASGCGGRGGAAETRTERRNDITGRKLGAPAGSQASDGGRTDCFPKITQKCQSKCSALGGSHPVRLQGFLLSSANRAAKLRSTSVLGSGFIWRWAGGRR